MLPQKQAPIHIADAVVRVSHTFKVANQTKQAAGVYKGCGLPHHLFGHIHVQTELEAWADLQLW